MEGFFWEDFLGGMFREDFFVYIGIDLFVKILICIKILIFVKILIFIKILILVKILVFVKILSQCEKEGKFRSLEVRRKLIALKK